VELKIEWNLIVWWTSLPGPLFSVCCHFLYLWCISGFIS